MNPKVKQIILYSALLVVGTYFLILGAFHAKSFLIPISIAILLSMVLVPVAEKLESWGLGRGWSVLLSDLLILGFCVGLFFLVSAQVQNVAEEWPTYREKLQEHLQKLQAFVMDKTGVSPEAQKEEVKEMLSERGKASTGKIGAFFSSFLSSLGNSILVFIYIFFFLFYRDKFRKSVLTFFPENKKDDADRAIGDINRVSQQYLFGRFMLILFLAVIYTIGLSISGVENALLISCMAAILSLIPYIGNMIGIVLAGMIGLLSGGGSGVLLGIAITFTIAQFVESYILEPYVVGNRVDLNPAFTILGVVAGGAVWGTAGMIIAIPIMGITKVICDHVPQLRPLGHLLGEEGIDKSDSWEEKIMKKLKRKKS